jgi:hypothetical protein
MSTLDPRNEPIRRALAQLSEIQGSGESCLDAAAIWDSAAEQLSPEEDAAVIRHIGECSACGVAWELARDLAPTEESRSEAKPDSTRSKSTRWMPLAAAALIVVAVGAAILLIPRGVESPSQPGYRDVAAPWLVSEVSEEVPLPRDAVILRWAAGPAGTTYDVRVTSDSLEPLAQGWYLEEPELRIDPSQLAGVEPGGKILWRVTAQLASGEKVVSNTFINTVE